MPRDGGLAQQQMLDDQGQPLTVNPLLQAMAAAAAAGGNGASGAGADSRRTSYPAVPSPLSTRSASVSALNGPLAPIVPAYPYPPSDQVEYAASPDAVEIEVGFGVPEDQNED